jgi:hypothetical protein
MKPAVSKPTKAIGMLVATEVMGIITHTFV